VLYTYVRMIYHEVSIMKIRTAISLMIFLALVLLPSIAFSQDIDTVADSGIDTATQRVDFSLYYDSLSLSLETWDETKPPDTVKLEAYKVASGFLFGVPFHFEANRNKITVTEQVNQVAADLKYNGSTQVDNAQRFDFSISVPMDRVTMAKSGKSFPGHGTGDDESYAAAREIARTQALDEAIRTAMSEAYLRQNIPMPGMLDGLIMWYEITNEGLDKDATTYAVDLTAWISLPKPPAVSPDVE
jgi:hypothetical protein